MAATVGVYHGAHYMQLRANPNSLLMLIFISLYIKDHISKGGLYFLGRISMGQKALVRKYSTPNKRIQWSESEPFFYCVTSRANIYITVTESKEAGCLVVQSQSNAS